MSKKGSSKFGKSPASSSARLLNSFMWNDRDCNAKNYFICERPMEEEGDAVLQGSRNVKEPNQSGGMGKDELGKW